MSVALGLTAVGAVVGSIVAVYALGPAAPAAVVTILVCPLGTPMIAFELTLTILLRMYRLQD